jgi:hypothetical protein
MSSAQPAGACRRCTENGTLCIAESVITCTQCLVDKAWCSMMCQNCMVGHRVCLITVDKENKTCDVCKRMDRECVAGPTDPVEIKALRNSRSRAHQTGMVNTSQDDGSYSQEKGSGAESSLAAARSTSASGLGIRRSFRSTTIKVENKSNNSQAFEMDSDTEMPPPPTPSQESSQSSSAKKRAKNNKKKSNAAVGNMSTPSNNPAQSSKKKAKVTAGIATPSNEHAQSGEKNKATAGNLSTPSNEHAEGVDKKKSKTPAAHMSIPSEHAQVAEGSATRAQMASGPSIKNSNASAGNMFAPSELAQVGEGFAPVAQMVSGPSTTGFSCKLSTPCLSRCMFEGKSNAISAVQAAVAVASAQKAPSQATSSAAGASIDRPGKFSLNCLYRVYVRAS